MVRLLQNTTQTKVDMLADNLDMSFEISLQTTATKMVLLVQAQSGLPHLATWSTSRSTTNDGSQVNIEGGSVSIVFICPVLENRCNKNLRSHT
ncbi:hypothetical protein O9992_00695 [Vibrio lentus]|nr:hypothetical protein [Vibrio lentus]